MRIQFSVNESEHQKLQELAAKDGYPDVHTYCKDTSLQQRTYAELWERVVSGIAKIGDEEFRLRDLIAAPPANLGVKLFRNQAALGITKVREENGTDVYKKI